LKLANWFATDQQLLTSMLPNLIVVDRDEGELDERLLETVPDGPACKSLKLWLC
jgi:hypothetical protein